MNWLAVLAMVVALIVRSDVRGSETRSPERLGAHWARVSDRAQIQLILDEVWSAAEGRVGGMIERKHVAHGTSLLTDAVPQRSATVSAARNAAANEPSVTVTGNAASVDFSSGERVLLEKSGGRWRIVSGTIPSSRTPRSLASFARSEEGVSVGETFITTPVSRDHGIDRLSRNVTQQKINRELFSTPEKTASYYYAHYMQNAPYVEATYIQFVTDPEWNRIVYGNMNHWLKSYGNVRGPSAIAVDADGRVFVGETGNERVSVLRVIGGGNEAALQPLFLINNITNPTDVALSDNGTPLNTSDDILYVADASENKVLKFALGQSSAALIATFEGFDCPTSVLVGKWNGASSGFVYVIDKIAKRIRVFDDLGTELSVITEVQGDYSQYFKALRTDHFGNVYVVDNVNSQVFKFTASLELLDVQGGDEMFAALGNVDIPFGKIVIDGQGTYWAGFDQMFAVERWDDLTGAQRRTLGLGLKNIQFRTDDDISSIENHFAMTDFGEVNIRVFDSASRLVRTLGSTWMVSGRKTIVWDRRNDAGAQVPAGTYRYEIAAKSAYRDELTISKTRFYLPAYYWEDCGTSNHADDSHLVQGSAVVWGGGPSETANEHASSLQYRFIGLNPESDYEVAAEYVAHDGVPRLQDMTVGGMRLHEPVRVFATPEKSEYFRLPKESYAGGQVTISINRVGQGTAIASQLWFKEVGVGFSAHAVSEVIPKTYALEQNYPNPFNPSTIIRYAIPSDGHVTLKVYSITGQEVATLVSEEKSVGQYEVRFDAAAHGKQLASGVYLYQLRAGDFKETKKFVLLK